MNQHFISVEQLCSLCTTVFRQFTLLTSTGCSLSHIYIYILFHLVNFACSSPQKVWKLIMINMATHFSSNRSRVKFRMISLNAIKNNRFGVMTRMNFLLKIIVYGHQKHTLWPRDSGYPIAFVRNSQSLLSILVIFYNFPAVYRATPTVEEYRGTKEHEKKAGYYHHTRPHMMSETCWLTLVKF